MRRQVLSILVENTSGVLSHVSGLFSRRGYNIDSFSAGVTADPEKAEVVDTLIFTPEEGEVINDLEPGEKALLPNEQPDTADEYANVGAATEIVKADMEDINGETGGGTPVIGPPRAVEEGGNTFRAKRRATSKVNYPPEIPPFKFNFEALIEVI